MWERIQSWITPTAEELDGHVLGPAMQHDFRLGWSATDTGQMVFKWRWRGQDVWLADWLDNTPSEGIPRFVLHERGGSATSREQTGTSPRRPPVSARAARRLTA